MRVLWNDETLWEDSPEWRCLQLTPKGWEWAGVVPDEWKRRLDHPPLPSGCHVAHLAIGALGGRPINMAHLWGTQFLYQAFCEKRQLWVYTEDPIPAELGTYIERELP